MAKKTTSKKVMRYASDPIAMFYKHAVRYTDVNRVLSKVFSKISQSNIGGLLKEEDKTFII